MSAEMNIDDELRAEYRRIYKDEAADEPAEEVAETVAEPAAVDDRPRDEAGKFVKAEADKTVQEPTETPSPAATPPPVVEAAVSAAPLDEPQRDINRAPSSWKPAAKSVWDKLPPEIRQEVHRRESDFLKGQSGLLPDAKFGQTMRQVIDPYRMLIDSEGGTPERAVTDLLRTAAVLRMGTPQQKQQVLLRTAQQYGVALPQPQAAQGAAPAGQSFSDPRVDQLIQQLQQEQLNRQAEDQRRQQSEQSAIEATAGAWINELDASGKPLRPYIDDVMIDMNALVPQIRAAHPEMTHRDVLQNAYDRATWAHPEIRGILQKEQQQQLEARSRTENQERVNLAKKASSVNVTRRGSSLAPAKPGSMDDTLRETARALGLTN